MRISTTQIYRQGIEAFGQQQVKLSKLQQQISTGVKLTKPSDDPAASSRALELQQSISIRTQYQVNITLADNRLSLEETTLASIETMIFRLKELAIQSNNAALDQVSLRAIAVEVEERTEELLSLANTRDGNGDFLFAGYQSTTQPFVDSITGSIQHVVYNGDQGQRSLQISESRQITVDNSGSELFMELSSVTALNETTAAANTGTGVMAPAHVFDASVYVPGPYEIRFTAPGVYDVFDVTNAVNIVTGATYTDSADIDFQGIRTSITGVPSAGDVFSVDQGQYKNMFESLTTLSETLRSFVSNAQKEANIAGFLTELDDFQSRVLDVRTSIGGRLNALDAQREINDASIVVTKNTLSTLRDTD
ncbi:MAG: flagellar hook-associated protein 3, partial [Gammaproteobacteria bacterium]|nr:flagellar hook-associated protein 3 [Gammaproteobacteria bacterium]